jgi:hypothetical protein
MGFRLSWRHSCDRPKQERRPAGRAPPTRHGRRPPRPLAGQGADNRHEAPGKAAASNGVYVLQEPFLANVSPARAHRRLLVSGAREWGLCSIECTCIDCGGHPIAFPAFRRPLPHLPSGPDTSGLRNFTIDPGTAQTGLIAAADPVTARQAPDTREGACLLSVLSSIRLETQVEPGPAPRDSQRCRADPCRHHLADICVRSPPGWNRLRRYPRPTYGRRLGPGTSPLRPGSPSPAAPAW